MTTTRHSADVLKLTAARVQVAMNRKAPAEMRHCPACAASTFHFEVGDGEYACRFVGSHEPLPEVGMGASKVYVTDTRAMVITRVTAKQVRAALVATEDAVRDTAVDQGPFPVIVEEGILTDIVGDEEVFRLHKNGRYYNASGCRLRIGRSVSRTDYRM